MAAGKPLARASGTVGVATEGHCPAALAAGRQPSSTRLGDASYLLRSTAFYGNGKLGTQDFGGYPPGHPLAVPCRAQMLSAWLLREFSYDLVEHCARHRSTSAVGFDNEWRRFFGLGNATGLGLVPYLINHPMIMDAWVAMRELALAHALGQDATRDSATVRRVNDVLNRAERYFAERGALQTAPYTSYPDLATGLRQVQDAVREYLRTGRLDGALTERFAEDVHALAAGLGDDVRQIVASILVEVNPEIDDEIEDLLWCDEHRPPILAQSCGTLRTRVLATGRL